MPFLTPILIMLGKMALKMVTAQAMEDLVIWSLDRLKDNTQSKGTQELVDIAKKHLKE